MTTHWYTLEGLAQHLLTLSRERGTSPTSGLSNGYAPILTIVNHDPEVSTQPYTLIVTDRSTP